MELGIKVDPNDIRGCKNTSGSDMAKGVCVKLKATPTEPFEIDLETSDTGAVYGVTMQAIADDARGDVQIRGVAQVLASTTIAAGVRVCPTTAGKSVTASTGKSNLGLALTAGTASALHYVELAGPGGSACPAI